MSDTFSFKWNAAVVFLSIGLAFIGAYSSIILCEQFRLCSKENQPKILSRGVLMWLMAMALGGVAIWSMHFVGMSAISFVDPFGEVATVQYRLDLTLISLLVVIFVCYAGIWISSRDGVYVHDNEDHIENFIKDAANMSIQELRAMRHKRYVLFITLFKNMRDIGIGGVITATGVCVMHYIGMEAMIVENGKMEWDSGIVTASVVIALVAATAAFWILFRLLALYPYMEVLRIASAIVAAVAVNGMHYTGMAALKLTYSPGYMPDIPKGSMYVDQSNAMIGAIIASMIFLWLIVLTVMADLRAWFYQSSQTIRVTDNMMKKLRHTAENEYMNTTVMPTSIMFNLTNTYASLRNTDFYSKKNSDKSNNNNNSKNDNTSTRGGISNVIGLMTRHSHAGDNVSRHFIPSVHRRASSMFRSSVAADLSTPTNGNVNGAGGGGTVPAIAGAGGARFARSAGGSSSSKGSSVPLVTPKEQPANKNSERSFILSFLNRKKSGRVLVMNSSKEKVYAMSASPDGGAGDEEEGGDRGEEGGGGNVSDGRGDQGDPSALVVVNNHDNPSQPHLPPIHGATAVVFHAF